MLKASQSDNRGEIKYRSRLEEESARAKKLQSNSARNIFEKRRQEGVQNKGDNKNISKKELLNSNLKKELSGDNQKTNNIFDKTKIATKTILSPLKQMDMSKDGLYMVVFMISVMADIVTLAIGLVGAIPVIGWIVRLVGEGATLTLLAGFQSIIVMLYILNGHYKKRKAILKVAVTMGFFFLETIPEVEILPGFIGAFIINYGIVLYGRAIEEEIKKSQAGVISRGNRAMAIRERAKERIYTERASVWQGQTESQVADDYTHKKAI